MQNLKHKFLETNFLVYIAKCMIGLAITFTIYQKFPQHQFFWSVISVLLAFSPDDKDAKKVAYDRMKANVLGSVLGMIIFLIHVPSLILNCIGVLFTIVIATALNIQSTTRSAMAAFIIVLLYEQKDASRHVALERMFCVILGCLIALILTLIFDVIIYEEKRRRYLRKATAVHRFYSRQK